MKNLFRLLTTVCALMLGAAGLRAQSYNVKFIPNDSATGTTQFTLTKINSSGNAVIMATTDTNGYTGVCVANCGKVGTAVIQYAGPVPLIMSNTSTALHYVQISGATGGDGLDSGATTFPVTGSGVIGRVMTGAAAAGTAQVDLALEIQPASAGGGSITVNGGGAGTNFGNTPAAIVGAKNVTPQISSGNFSAYVNGFLPRPDTREVVMVQRPQGGANGFDGYGEATGNTTNATGRNVATSTTPPTVTLSSTAAASTFGSMLGAASVSPGSNVWYYADFQLAQITNVRFWKGLSNSTPSTIAASDSNATTQAAMLRFSTAAADTKWTCVVSNGATQTTTASTVNADTAYHRLNIVENVAAANWQFFLDGVQICGNITTNLPTSGFAGLEVLDQVGAGAAVSYNSNGYYIEAN
jgi:hypothetical protein